MVDDEAFAHEPADGDAVLEERVHPRIGVRVVRRGGAVDGVATGVRGHGHHGHAVGEASVDGLQALVVEGLGEQNRGEGFDHLRVGDGAVASSCAAMRALVSSVCSPPRPRIEVRDGEAQGFVLFGVRLP